MVRQNNDYKEALGIVKKDDLLSEPYMDLVIVCMTGLSGATSSKDVEA